MPEPPRVAQNGKKWGVEIDAAESVRDVSLTAAESAESVANAVGEPEHSDVNTP